MFPIPPRRPPNTPRPAGDQAGPTGPTRIGRFYVVKELGRGSIGTVYLARDPVIDRQVAIKTTLGRPTAVDKRVAEQQFINEARAAGRLAHPGIVTIYDACTEEGPVYIVMEFLQGRELHRLLENGKRFSVEDTVAIAIKICDAVQYAHEHEVIHRDIKPANIFLTDDMQPKLMDFGIARAPNRVQEGQNYDDAPYTMFQNNLLGTPNYMSPEQAMGKSVDKLTDIYSVAAIMYEMLTGQRPFQAEDTDKLLEMIAFKAPLPPHDVHDEIPVVLSQIIMKAMSKRPERRYQSAGDMAEDLRRYQLMDKRERQKARRDIESDQDAARDGAAAPGAGQATKTQRKAGGTGGAEPPAFASSPKKSAVPRLLLLLVAALGTAAAVLWSYGLFPFAHG